MNNKEFDFEAFKKQAIAGMYAGKPLNGERTSNAQDGQVQASLLPCSNIF
jgi:hypothetical protein